MKRILILGKNGQLGQEFVNILGNQDKEFVAFSREELDVANIKNLKKNITKYKPNVIINTTAYHVTSDCEKYPLKAFNINCVAVANMAKISREIGAKFVTYSTNYVFDGVKKTSYKEEDIPNPLQMYGLSKLAGELAAMNEYPNGTFVIRTCSVFGGKSGSKSKKGNYILKILEEARNNAEIFASKKQIVNPTYASHLAKSTLSLLSLNAGPGIYHLVNDGKISWFEYAQKIIELSQIKNVKVREFKNDEENKNFKSPVYSALLNTKAKKLGVELPSIEDSLREYLIELQSEALL